MDQTRSFFVPRQAALKIAAALYVLGLILSHATLPALHVWVIAAVFSIIMNLVYILEAVWQGRRVGAELAVMLVLIAASLMGVFVHPGFVIAAVFGHGAWDLAKHFGAGIAFFSWYTLGCAGVDAAYGAVLLAYWMTG